MRECGLGIWIGDEGLGNMDWRLWIEIGVWIRDEGLGNVDWRLWIEIENRF